MPVWPILTLKYGVKVAPVDPESIEKGLEEDARVDLGAVNSFAQSSTDSRANARKEEREWVDASAVGGELV